MALFKFLVLNDLFKEGGKKQNLNFIFLHAALHL